MKNLKLETLEDVEKLIITEDVYDVTEKELLELGFTPDYCGTECDTPEGCNDYYMRHPLFEKYEDEKLYNVEQIHFMFTVADRLELVDEVVRVDNAEELKGRVAIWIG